MTELRVTIPNDLHQSLREKAVKSRKTVKELVIELLEKGVKEP